MIIFHSYTMSAVANHFISNGLSGLWYYFLMGGLRWQKEKSILKYAHSKLTEKDRERKRMGEWERGRVSEQKSKKEAEKLKFFLRYPWDIYTGTGNYCTIISISNCERWSMCLNKCLFGSRYQSDSVLWYLRNFNIFAHGFISCCFFFCVQAIFRRFQWPVTIDECTFLLRIISMIFTKIQIVFLQIHRVAFGYKHWAFNSYKFWTATMTAMAKAMVMVTNMSLTFCLQCACVCLCQHMPHMTNTTQWGKENDADVSFNFPLNQCRNFYFYRHFSLNRTTEFSCAIIVAIRISYFVFFSFFSSMFSSIVFLWNAAATAVAVATMSNRW